MPSFFQSFFIHSASWVDSTFYSVNLVTLAFFSGHIHWLRALNPFLYAIFSYRCTSGEHTMSLRCSTTILAILYVLGTDMLFHTFCWKHWLIDMLWHKATTWILCILVQLIISSCHQLWLANPAWLTAEILYVLGTDMLFHTFCWKHWLIDMLWHKATTWILCILVQLIISSCHQLWLANPAWLTAEIVFWWT